MNLEVTTPVAARWHVKCDNKWSDLFSLDKDTFYFCDFHSDDVADKLIVWSNQERVFHPPPTPRESTLLRCAVPVRANEGRLVWQSYEKPASETAGEDKALGEIFIGLVKKWREDTSFHSSLSKQFVDPSYQAIIGLGMDGVPFVLRELRDSNDHWFYALKLMAREDVAKGIKSFDDAKAAWLDWGYKKGLI